MKILLIEDDRKIGRFVEKGLQENAYVVVWCRLIKEAEKNLSEDSFDLIILDLGLPDGNGLDFLDQWRGAGFNEPVLILSARDSVSDRVEGLNLGADDYLPKPFSFEELLARVRSLFRRQTPTKRTFLEHRGIRMDLLAHTVFYGNSAVQLTNREYALLELFLLNRGRVLTRTQIAEKVWEASYDMQTNLIDVYVRKLRKHFEAEDAQEPIIRTVRGVGYQMQ